jgi:hypothetical protein
VHGAQPRVACEFREGLGVGKLRSVGSAIFLLSSLFFALGWGYGGSQLSSAQAQREGGWCVCHTVTAAGSPASL